MNRREFLKKISGILVAIPFIGFLFGKTEAEPVAKVIEQSIKPPYVDYTAEFFNSQELTKLLHSKFSTVDNNLPFLNRTKIVNCLDDTEVIAYGGYISKGFSADIMLDGESKASGTFEVTGVSIPSIKIGNTVSDSIINRLGRVSNEIKTEESLRFLNDYKSTLADSLALGMKQRMNLEILQVMLGGKIETPARIGIKLDIPEELHINVEWSKPLTAIKQHILNISEKFGATYNRMTLGTPAYKKFIESDEVKEAFVDYRKANKIRFDEFISVYRDKNNNVEPSDNIITMHFMPTVIHKETGMFVELYDATYSQRKNDGGIARVRVLPDNKVLFSDTSKDLQSMHFDYAQAIVTETIVAPTILGKNNDIGGVAFGPIGYFTGNRQLNPPNMVAWAVTKGLPRLHDRHAFSSFTI